MMDRIISASICGALALISLVIGILSFQEKGFLFNNAYIWASKTDREKMDKHPHYRQSSIVFTLLAAMFFCMAVEALLTTGWLWIAVGIICLIVLVYAVKSSI